MVTERLFEFRVSQTHTAMPLPRGEALVQTSQSSLPQPTRRPAVASVATSTTSLSAALTQAARTPQTTVAVQADTTQPQRSSSSSSRTTTTTTTATVVVRQPRLVFADAGSSRAPRPTTNDSDTEPQRPTTVVPAQATDPRRRRRSSESSVGSDGEEGMKDEILRVLQERLKTLLRERAEAIGAR